MCVFFCLLCYRYLVTTYASLMFQQTEHGSSTGQSSVPFAFPVGLNIPIEDDEFSGTGKCAAVYLECKICPYYCVLCVCAACCEKW